MPLLCVSSWFGHRETDSGTRLVAATRSCCSRSLDSLSLISLVLCAQGGSPAVLYGCTDDGATVSMISVWSNDDFIRGMQVDNLVLRRVRA